jgi:hypothetical protein
MDADKSIEKTDPLPFSTAQNRFLDALRATFGNVTAACSATGTARATFYVWRKNPAFADAVADIDESNLDKAESALLGLIESGNPTAIIFYLKTKGRLRGYHEKHEIDAWGSAPVNIVFTQHGSAASLATDD